MAHAALGVGGAVLRTIHCPPGSGKQRGRGGSQEAAAHRPGEWGRQPSKAFKAGDPARLLEDFTATQPRETICALVVDLLRGKREGVVRYRRFLKLSRVRVHPGTYAIAVPAPACANRTANAGCRSDRPARRAGALGRRA